jgi:hypothetical protein
VKHTKPVLATIFNIFANINMPSRKTENCHGTFCSFLILRHSSSENVRPDHLLILCIPTLNLMPSLSLSSSVRMVFMSRLLLKPQVTWKAVLQVFTEHWIHAPTRSLHRLQISAHRLGCNNRDKTVKSNVHNISRYSPLRISATKWE